MRKYIFTLSILLCGIGAAAQTLTFAADPRTVHVGDKIPPLTWTNPGFSSSNWTTAVASGNPTCSTTYTSASPVGTYPITCAVGTLVPQSGWSFAFTTSNVTVIAATGIGTQNITTLSKPTGMMQSVKAANSTCTTAAAGDGVTDDTAALLCFFHNGRGTTGTFGNNPKQYYLPTGTYLVSAQLKMWGSAIALFGDGPDKTIIKLAPASSGYGTSCTTTSTCNFIWFEGGLSGGTNNNGYNEHFEDMSIEIGAGNPGAQGIQFIGNNFDAVKNVWVYYDDGVGKCAFCINQALPGQTTFKNIAAYGGTYGYQANGQAEYNALIYNGTFENQTGNGILIGGFDTAMENIFSVNTVNAIANGTSASTLLNGELLGGTSANAVTNTSGGSLYIRNVNSTGYTNLMTDSNGGAVLSSPVAEHWSGTAQTIFSTATPTGIIITPVLETPTPSDPSSAGWCPVSANINNWGTDLSSCASTTAYVPVSCNYPLGVQDCSAIATNSGVYNVSGGGTINVTVPCSINHIFGDNFAATSGTFVNFVNNCNSTTTPLILDHFTSTAGTVTFTHTGSRPMVIEDVNAIYNCSTGAGDIFIEDSQIELTNFCSGQTVWGRGLDDETAGNLEGITSVGYASATTTLTIVGSVDPAMTVGSAILFGAAITPSSWLQRGAAKITNISGSTMTATWYGAANPDQAPTTQSAGNYTLQPDKMTCTGCRIWALGFKTEKPSTQINITNGKLEIDGFFTYPVFQSPNPWQDFTITDTDTFLTGSIFSSLQWTNFVNETRSGSNGVLANPGFGGSSSSNLTMFYSIGGPPPPTSTARIFGSRQYGSSIK